MGTYCSHYSAAIARSDSLPANLVTVLVPAIHQVVVMLRLRRDRRSRGSWCSWQHGAYMADVLSANELARAFKEHLSPPAQPSDGGSGADAGSSNAQQLLATACQLMVHVPLDMADGTPSLLAMLLSAFSSLLGRVCSHIRAALWYPVQWQLTGQRQGDHTAWDAGAQYPRLTQQLVHVLPRLPATLQLLVEGRPLQHVADSVQGLCGGWCQAVGLLQALAALSPRPQASCRAIVSSWTELAAWCTACSALLRGRALTAALVRQYNSQPAEQSVLSNLKDVLLISPALPVAAAAFAEQQHMPEFDAPLSGPIITAAETALWDLHTALCRSAHQLLPEQADQSLHLNLDSPNQTLLAAWRLHRCAQRGVSQPFGR
jgi:hypothetical protein